eukprot:14194227-Alexandrium_andersonii.AAC.1
MGCSPTYTSSGGGPSGMGLPRLAAPRKLARATSVGEPSPAPEEEAGSAAAARSSCSRASQ